ncbi:BppU family phage baseplate upper protein, partial [Bacillus wiedmannii]
MRTETMLIDLANMSMTRTISSRENDRNGFKVIINLKERGKPVDLTGFAVFYEAISPLGFFVRDIAVITNFRDGVFEYTVSKEAVSSAGVWVGYFAFEKGTERFTTQDIRISLGADVKSGSIQLENYIAEFDKLKKQIDALQVAVDKADVVKKSGETMTGSLHIELGGSRDKRIAWQENGKLLWGLTGNKDINFSMHDWKNNKSVWLYDGNKFDMKAETNLLKRTGDTMTGELTVPSLKTLKDTDWTNLTLINGVTNQTGKKSQVKRLGNVVSLTMNVIGVKNNQIIATLPTDFRPLSDMVFSSSYIKNDLNSAEGIITIRADGSVHCE